MGHRVGIVSRGYGRRDRRDALVSATADPREWGDEAVLHAQAGFTVAVARRRRTGVALLATTDVTLVLADDGLQHRDLPRQAEIAVIDPACGPVAGCGNGYLLPVGPLREPPRPVDLTLRRHVDIHLHLDGAISLADGRTQPLAAFRNTACHAIAGIAQPERFFAALRQAGLTLTTQAFPDHHPFTAADFAAFAGQTVLMTAKDAVKCRGFALANCWCVPAKAVFPPTAQAQVLALLARFPPPSSTPPH